MTLDIGLFSSISHILSIICRSEDNGALGLAEFITL